MRGLQSQGVAATVKHFVSNDPETERFTSDVRVDERTRRELCLAPFEAVEVHARLAAREPGTHLVGGTGTGRFVLALDGRVRADERLALARAADPAEAMTRPPQLAVPVELGAGDEVDLRLRYEPGAPGGVEGADLATVTVQLNAAVQGGYAEGLWVGYRWYERGAASPCSGSGTGTATRRGPTRRPPSTRPRRGSCRYGCATRGRAPAGRSCRPARAVR